MAPIIGNVVIAARCLTFRIAISFLVNGDLLAQTLRCVGERTLVPTLPSDLMLPVPSVAAGHSSFCR